MKFFTHATVAVCFLGVLRKYKLDHVSEAGVKRDRDIFHVEELNPVLIEAT